MSLFLIHKTFDGEPVGVHSDDGGSYYVPGHDKMETGGKGLVGSRRKEYPWSQFVDQQVSQVSQRDWWSKEDSDLMPQQMQQVLDEARSTYLAQKNDE